jgi:hypothetical protein
MTSVSTQQSKIMRWLSPLLLVSLGLHGLGLLVPIPRKAEVLNEPEELALESIPVSILPAEPLPDALVVEPVPPSVPIQPELVPPEIYPITVPAVPLPAPELEDPLVQSQPSPTLDPEEVTQPSELEPTETIESNKPDKTSSLTPQELRPVGTQSEYLASYQEFQDLITDLGNKVVADPINREVYELDYLQSSCFPDVEKVNGSVGVIFDSTSRLYAAKIISSTRIDVVDAALEEWFNALKEGEDRTTQIEAVFNPTLYEWTDEYGQQPVATEENGYKAYTFKIDINLSDNC